MASRSRAEPSPRRRFVTASAAGTGVAAIPFLWVLWSLWGPFKLLRQTNLQDNFYDLQARAMFHGHLYVPNGSIGIEAFLHNGHQYTYFGLFPSIIRMPILLVTSSLDAKLTAPSMALAWLLTAVLTAMLVWRLRIMVRGNAAMARIEAVSMGVLMAVVMGGSVVLYLAASPYVFSEDLIWSVCLTVGSFFALLGIIERPSWGRVLTAGGFILAANLDRATTGWACAVATLLIAGWMAAGRNGEEERRWWVPVLLIGLVPILVSVAVDMAKFGIPFGVPSTEQLYTKVNAYRRRFLAANHNSEVGLAFIPSDIYAYLRPWGIRFEPVFPYVTLPARPAAELGGVLFDKRYRTASVPASMPMLFLLSCWGLVTAFRPRASRALVGTRFLLLAAGGAAVALFLWGYIAPRYLADFMPLLVLGGALGLIDLFRRAEGWSRWPRGLLVGSVFVLAAYSFVANFGITAIPTEEWTTTQSAHFVETVKAFSDVTGNPLEGTVHQVADLPAYAPAGQLFIVGNCDGLYISNGEDYSTVPTEQFQRYTWMAVERGPAIQHSFRVVLREPTGPGTESVPLVSVGEHGQVALTVQSVGKGLLRVGFDLSGVGQPGMATPAVVRAGSQHVVVVVTDPAKHEIAGVVDGQTALAANVVVPGSARVTAPLATGGAPPAVEITNTTPSSLPPICRSLLADRQSAGSGSRQRGGR